MKRIIVTPAGRKKYMDLLAKHLAKQRSSFDEWHIWQNTENIEDIQFFNTLDAKIIIPKISDPKLKNVNLNNFYAIDSFDEDTLYLKLDDDIVWMEPDFIDKMFSLREQNNTNFLIFANTINNSTCGHLHMRNNQIPWNDMAGYNTFDSIFWSSPLYAESVHHTFLSNAKDFTKFYFSDWHLFLNERVSINAVAWRGSDFAFFNGFIDGEDELFLTYHGPSRALGKRSFIYGQALCSHYSYKTQMEYLDRTKLLERYIKIANFSV
jgi:hypothetical protein